jgi:hypothetical protein
MEGTMVPRLLLAAFVLAAAACGDGCAPTDPGSIPAAPTAPSAASGLVVAGEQWDLTTAEQWDLTTTFRGFTGPDACGVYAKHVGESNSWSMTVQRSGTSVRLILTYLEEAATGPVEAFPTPKVPLPPAIPAPPIEYVGTVISDALSAAAKIATTGRVCGGARVSVGSDRRVSGRFSADGRALSGHAVDSSPLSSVGTPWVSGVPTGETIVFYADWNAIRK